MSSTLNMTLYNSREKTGNVIFTIGDEKIRAHKCVLAAVSSKFEDYFYGPDKPDGLVIISNERGSPETIEEFIKFCYLGKMNMSFSHAEDIFSLSEKWAITDCATKYESFLEHYLKQKSVNVFSCFYEAVKNDWKRIQQYCEEKFIKNISSAFESMYFLDCNRHVLAKLLNMRPLNCSTIYVMRACISWAETLCQKKHWNEKCPKALRKALGDLINLIPVDTLTVKDFYCLNKECDGFFTPQECIEITTHILTEGGFKGTFGEMIQQIHKNAEFGDDAANQQPKATKDDAGMLGESENEATPNKRSKIN